MKMAGILPGMAVLGMAVLLGALVADAFPFPIPVELPPVALFAAVLILAALPVLVGRWTLTLGIFLVWLVVEDLVRKLAGNNLAVYFVKDLIYFVLLFALFTSASLQQAWRRATGQTRWILYALVCWAVIMVVPTIRRRLALALGRTASRLSLRALGGGGLSLGSANLKAAAAAGRPFDSRRGGERSRDCPGNPGPGVSRSS